MDYEPEGAAEKVGDALGIVKRRVKGDLERFKELIEGRGAETGAWPGSPTAAWRKRAGRDRARPGVPKRMATG